MKPQPVFRTLAISILGLAISCSIGEKSERGATKKTYIALLKELKSRSSEARLEAASALGELGPAAKKAVPAMIAALEDDDPFVLSQLAKSLRRIGPPDRSDIPAIIQQLLKHPAKYVRMGAAEALGRCPTQTPAILEALTTAAQEQDEFVRAASRESLKRLAE